MQVLSISVVSWLGLEAVCVCSPGNYFKLMRLVLTLNTRSSFIFHLVGLKKDWKCNVILKFFHKHGCFKIQCCESGLLLDKHAIAEETFFYSAGIWKSKFKMLRWYNVFTMSKIKAAGNLNFWKLRITNLLTS